jgi:predicted nucleic acid-binding protein
LFQKAEAMEVELYTSSHSIATTYFVLKKFSDDKKLRAILSDLLHYVSIIPIDINLIRRGLNSKYKDFEDGLQILCAQSIDQMDCIVTRDLKDFKQSNIAVYSPDTVIEKLA